MHIGSNTHVRTYVFYIVTHYTISHAVVKIMVPSASNGVPLLRVCTFSSIPQLTVAGAVHTIQGMAVCHPHKCVYVRTAVDGILWSESLHCK